MSSDVTYSTKSYRNDWISQFGLYRYESATSPKRVEYERRNRLVLRIIFSLGTTLFLALLIFYIGVYMSSYNETDRMLFSDDKPETDAIEPNYSNPLTTVFYPDDQISSYQHTISSTTPMTGKNQVSNNENGLVSFVEHDDAEDRSIKIIPTANTWHPFNHKRHYSNVYRNKIGPNSVHDLYRKSIFDTTTPQKRIFYSDDIATDDNDENFDYIDPVQNVNSIQDILNHNEPEGFSEEITYVAPSLPFSRRMKVEGIYRREKKKKHDHMSTMESGQHSSTVYDENVHQKNDPFSKFKPSKPGDVNLLASNNNMKFKQYTHHKPRPLTTPMTLNNYYEDYYGSRDPNIIYHQIIAANNKNRDATIRNGRFEKASTTKSNKPFSLMLDVYPMPEETTFDSSIQATIPTRIIPYNQYRRPFQPVNSHSINHNLQYGKENSFYSHLKFPQIQQYSPYRTQPFIANDGFYRNYITNRMNTNVYRTLSKPSPSMPISDLTTEDSPSQITVHLNLYPDRKKYHSRNVEIIHTDNNSTSTAVSSSVSPLLLTPSLNSMKHDHSTWKRLERENATKPISEIEIRPSRHTYIPPFSAIKINALQHPFDVNDANSSQQSSEHTDNSDKSAEYNDMVAFDSKKLHSNIKTVNMIFGPTPNPIVSTLPYFNEISPTISTELSSLTSSTSTVPTQFESTMSSSIYSSSTIAANHFPFFSSNSIPFETTAVIDTLNASKTDQSTTIYDNTIRFPDH
ncbi:uncharacterized protein LOC116338762 [Contarinia nasturtii]|uniref:uncharacterized protein LOC116338762 n=1 Tax=Contarinia nasturtii TaxID=265458 RepID=UPI0012D41101|nr:uncharacterized protein LOC116338762 [Contarinia nasturtii]